MRDANATTGIKGHLARVTATLEIRDAEQLSRILTRIERLPNVIEARRWQPTWPGSSGRKETQIAWRYQVSGLFVLRLLAAASAFLQF